jgi:L-ascorbate metabolism protein UlaG (beta-lactamase superfamily)
MSVEKITAKMHWLGHDTFRIDAGPTIYFDPYQIKPGPTADIIFISHDHYDHCSPEDIAKIQGPETVIVTSQSCLKKLTGNVQVVAPGDSLTVKGISVRVVPSYNINKKFHPKKKGWLGFVIEINGVRVYHAGDTDLIPEMKDIQADIVLLPVSGTYVMTAEEAAEAALTIKPALAVPMHYGTLVGEAADAERFSLLLEGKVQVKILEKE